MLEFVDPQIGKPDDRAWLDNAILKFIATRSEYERLMGKRGIKPRTDREIFAKFAPVTGGFRDPDLQDRRSWLLKPRKIRRQMLTASLRRLIANGKIRLHDEKRPNQKSMHGIERLEIERNRQIFGEDHDGVIRSYVETNALEALAQALGESDE